MPVRTVEGGGVGDGLDQVLVISGPPAKPTNLGLSKGTFFKSSLCSEGLDFIEQLENYQALLW